MNFKEITNIIKNFVMAKPIRLVVQYDICNINIGLWKYNEQGITSKTFYKLQKHKFIVKNNRESNGLAVTTIIDKKTDEPVRAYVARLEQEDNSEKYCIMVEDASGEIYFDNKQYKVVGDVYFYINQEKKMVMPKFELVSVDGEICERVSSYMNAPGNKDYAGIGTRLHQIRIERMFQMGLGNSFIVADGASFPFHYSMGYRLKPGSMPIEKSIGVLRDFSDWNKKSFKENTKYLYAEWEEGKYILNWSATLEHFLYDYYKEGGKPLEFFSPNMYLNEVSAKQWLDFIKKQPILCKIKYVLFAPMAQLDRASDYGSEG